jgi:translation initiation factor IF-3
VKEKKLRINQKITTKEVRLISPEGKLLGIFPIKEALAKAEELGLDLVEVAPQETPPICKLLDFAKYKYEKKKKEREIKKKQRERHLLSIVKEIRLSSTIQQHDLLYKKNHIAEFLKEGHKVKVTLFFKGREIIHPELGEELFNRLKEELRDLAIVENPPKLYGRCLSMVLTPRHPNIKFSK